jgi:hypothetical protein
LEARLTGSLLKKYRATVKKSSICVLFINQVRTKIRFMGPSTVEPAGGNALQHIMDIRLFLEPGKKLEKPVESLGKTLVAQYGAIAELFAHKSRYVRSSIKVPCPIIYGSGVSNLMFYAGVLQNFGFIVQKGPWYKINLPDTPEASVQGISGVQKWLKERLPEVRELVAGRLVLTTPTEEDTSDAG